MDEESKLPEDGKFSNDPEENMEMENQFLQLKLMAETGASFHKGDAETPPEIMNQWLKNIAKFEAEYADAPERSLRDIFGNPEFKASSELDDENFASAYRKLQALLAEHNIDVSFLRPRGDRFKYDFITSELLDQEAALFPGMMTGFIYEEFHPDHELEIQNRTREFFDAFFERRLGESDNPYFDGELILPDGNILPAAEMMKQFQAMYDAIPAFENTMFAIDKIDFELRENTTDQSPETTGMGYSEGTVKYDLILKSGERKSIDGPFKIYFTLEWNWWSIYFFYLAGFNLHQDGDRPMK